MENWLVIGLTQRGQGVKGTEEPFDFYSKELCSCLRHISEGHLKNIKNVS